MLIQPQPSKQQQQRKPLSQATPLPHQLPYHFPRFPSPDHTRVYVYSTQHNVLYGLHSMAASPEFYKPAPAAFPAPPCSPPLLVHAAGEELAADAWEECCRTPTVGGSHLKAPATCPPAPRKPRPPAAAACRKRLFEVELFSVRLEELERLFWPQPPAPREKRRRV